MRIHAGIRLAAWTVAAGALVAVVLGYDALPLEMPLTRWTTAPKSPLLALRVPAINLLTLGLVAVLSRGLHRIKEFDCADAVISVLALTAAAKAGIEAAALLLPDMPAASTAVPLFAVLIAGLGTAAVLSRQLLKQETWRNMHLTRLESVTAAVLIAGIAALNLPLILR